MCNALVAAGVDTLILTTDADGEGTLDVPVGEPTAWCGVPALFFNRNFSESFKYSRGLARWLRRHVAEFDVVHIHAVLSHACLSAASACRAHHVPYVLRPLGTLAPWSLRQKAFRKRVTLALGARRAILAAGAVHCTSDEERRGVERAFPGVNGVVIPLGIDDAFFDTTPLDGLQGNVDPYVLALSRIHPKKNLEALIEAFLAAAGSQREPWRLVIAGDGEPRYVEQLRQLAAKSGGNGRVTFAGWVDGAKKRALIQHASLFALTSLHENFGVSVLEALASGVPAILSAEVDLADPVREHAAGWVVQPTVEAIRTGLADAFSRPAERSARGAAARKLARRFAWPDIAAELVDLYERLHPAGARVGDRVASSAIAVEPSGGSADLQVGRR
jgi:glycosyltransferase involved in cell wall biosynthesis